VPKKIALAEDQQIDIPRHHPFHFHWAQGIAKGV